MELGQTLARLFNYTLSRGTLPIEWKTANVVPIFKSGEQTAVDIYHPVSLTSVVVKSLERLVHNHKMSFLSDNKLLCDNQHCFRPLCSRVTQLFQLVHGWLRILEERGSVDAIFLDFAKAFNPFTPATNNNITESRVNCWNGFQTSGLPGDKE